MGEDEAKMLSNTSKVQQTIDTTNKTSDVTQKTGYRVLWCWVMYKKVYVLLQEEKICSVRGPYVRFAVCSEAADDTRRGDGLSCSIIHAGG